MSDQVEKMSDQVEKMSDQVEKMSKNLNIYHCCVHKTGSQWIRHLFADKCVFQYSGLESYHYETEMYDGLDRRIITQRSFDKPFPIAKIVSPIYIDYKNYTAIPKPEEYKAFFVARDPRDIIVSYYFSAKYTHPLVGNLSHIRSDLRTMPVEDGLSYVIQALDQNGTFAALRTWADVPKDDARILIVRYEDLIGPQPSGVFRTLFEHCDIHLPDPILKDLVRRYSFENLSGGRQPGNEDQSSHFRKGIAGDWRNVFDNRLIRQFQKTTGDLVSALGYSPA